MPSISLRFDARQLKADVEKILEEKARALTSSQELYNSLSELFYSYVILYFPEDTGALKMTGQGFAKNGYYRRPKGTIGGHHGVEFDAVEERPSGDYHYAEPVIMRLFGSDPVVDGIIDRMKSDGLWEAFCEDAAEIIANLGSVV